PRQSLAFQVFAQSSGEEAGTRFVEENARPTLDEKPDLRQLVIANDREILLFHRLPVGRTMRNTRATAPGSTSVYLLFAAAAANSRISADCGADAGADELIRNCDNASFSCSDNFTMFSTVRAVCLAPCEVWRVMLEMICMALATPSVPRTCCFDANEISCTSSADWRTTVEIASRARPA